MKKVNDHLMGNLVPPWRANGIRDSPKAWNIVCEDDFVGVEAEAREFREYFVSKVDSVLSH